MENFIKLRDEFCKDLEIIQKNAELASWNFYTNSTEENLQKYSQAQEDYSHLFQNKELYEKFKFFKNEKLNDKHLEKQLKNLVKEFYDEIESGKELKALRDKENEIAVSYNSYVMMLDGEPISNTKAIEILEKDTNLARREKTYHTRIKGGELIADKLIELVKMRNTWAKLKGYDTYFDYMLEDTYEIKPENLNKLLAEVYERINNKFFEIFKQQQEDLAKSFGIKTEELKDYHFGFLTQENPEKEVTKYLNDVVAIASKAYENMGYDIYNMGITLDLFPRENKNTHGFAFCIEAGKDARILANLSNNIRSLETILHELGHCVYDIGIDINLPFLDKDCASSAMTEAVAMMMGDLPKTENILSELVPEDILTKFKQELPKDEIKFVARSLQIIEFEREMYKNPDQDLPQLWKDLKQKYFFRDFNTYKNNEWATIPHYLSHPAYYQNYFRASLIKAQLYNTLKEKFGEITKNKLTSAFLNENLFGKGASIEESELIKILTGKELGVEDFCNRF